MHSVASHLPRLTKTASRLLPTCPPPHPRPSLGPWLFLTGSPSRPPTLWDLASVQGHVLATACPPPSLPGPCHLFCSTYPKLLAIPEHSIQLPNSVSITKVASLSRKPFLSSSPGLPILQTLQPHLLQELFSSRACGPWGLCPYSHSSLCSVELFPQL